MGFLLLLGIGLTLMAIGADGLDVGEAISAERIFVPKGASAADAKWVVNLSGNINRVSWVVEGPPGVDGQRTELERGEALSRDQALDEASDAIFRAENKLPGAASSHGLKMIGSCERIDVVDLKMWIDWASSKIRRAAERESGPFAAEEYSAGSIMRWLFGQVFPACKEATPMLRDKSWADVARGAQRVMDKQLSGEFIDVNPIEVVLAARVVGMSAPATTGAAFQRKAPDGETYSAVITKQASNRWRWRIWRGPREGRPWTKGVETSKAEAVEVAKRMIDAQVGVAAGG